MTELEKRKKALDLARQKYPDVVDAAQLEKLARSMEKKKNIFRSLAMIMGGAVSVLFSLFVLQFLCMYRNCRWMKEHENCIHP